MCECFAALAELERQAAAGAEMKKLWGADGVRAVHEQRAINAQVVRRAEAAEAEVERLTAREQALAQEHYFAHRDHLAAGARAQQLEEALREICAVRLQTRDGDQAHNKARFQMREIAVAVLAAGPTKEPT
jgi:hypothetical protein